MSLESKYNLKSPGVKRLMREALELANPTEEYYACPMEDNLFEWHFTVRGPTDTEFAGGFYHGRILLPPQYPMKPPNIILLTPNGRFEVNKKICLSISEHHPETWQPSWSIRTTLMALIAFMPSKGMGTLGSLDYTPAERQKLAKQSQNWECNVCGKIAEKLIVGTGHRLGRAELTQEESSMLKSIALKAEEDVVGNNSSSSIRGEGEIKDGSFSSPATVSSSDSVVHRRNVPGSSNEPQPEVNHAIATTYLEPEKSFFWPVVIYVILFAIALILIKRLFFL